MWQFSSSIWVAGFLASTIYLSGTIDISAAIPWNTWHGSDYSMRHWKSEDGLPNNWIRGILQTRDGYLWLATPFGLARYNGFEFATLTLESWPNLQSDDCLALAEDKWGHLWIGTSHGLLRYRDRVLEVFGASDGLPSPTVLSLATTPDGTLWIGTPRGVAVPTAEGEGFQDVTEAMGFPREAFPWLHVSVSGTFYVANETALYRFIEGENRFVNALPEGGPAEFTAVLPEDTSGRLWLGTDQGVHFYQPRKGWTLLNESHGLKGRKVSFLYEHRSGTIWIHTRSGGMNIYHEGSFEVLPLEVKRQRGQGSKTVFEDQEGITWVGTDGSGLYALLKRQVEVYSAVDGLPYNTVWSVCADREGGMWVGTSRGIGHIVDGFVTSRLTYQEELDFNIKTLCLDDDDWLWVGKTGHGVHRQKHDIYEWLNEILGIPETADVNVLYKDRTGAMWIGHGTGLVRFDHGRVRHFGTKDGMTQSDVRAILQDHQGAMWFGTEGGGLWRWQDERFSVIDEDHGLSNNSVWTLHEDEEGVLWIGTRNGLNRWDNGSLFTFTRQHGLFDTLANQILEDDDGYLWISCLRGIFRINRRDLNAVAAGTLATVPCVVFGEADGMLNSETNGERQPAGCKDNQGRLWFSTQEGVAVLDPKRLRDDGWVPPVVIEQVLADGRMVLHDGLAPRNRTQPHEMSEPGPAPAKVVRGVVKAHFPPGTSRVLEIKYTGNSFHDPAKVQFQYRLLGWSSEWQLAGTRRTAVYTDLPPGHYTFQVSASNKHGTWNPTPAEFDFSIAAHFYETWVFYILCAMSVVGLAAGVQYYRLRVQRRFMEMERFHALEMERSRIAQDMHDDLGASLTKISILSEVAKSDISNPEAAFHNMDRISATARRVVDNITEIIWAINPRNDTLDNLCGYLREYAAQFFDQTQTACQIDFPEDIPAKHVTAELRRNVFLVVKEALNNIVRHAQASEVHIRLELAKDHLHLRIKDNGVGLPILPEGEQGTSLPTSRRAGGGAGLPGMRRRVASMGGALNVQSNPGHGTTIILDCALPPENSSSRPRE